MALDATTLLAVGIVVRLTAAGIALLAWYIHREVVCLLGWSAAMLLSALAMVVGSFRGETNALELTLATNLLFLAGYALMWTSMRRFNDDRLSPLQQALVVLTVCGVFAVLFILTWQFGSPRRAQSALFAIFIAGLTLVAAWETWRGYRCDGLRSRHIAAAALVAIAVTRFLRVGLIVLQSQGLVSQSTGELLQSYSLYVNIVFLLVATAGLALMAQERVDRAEPSRRPS